MSSSKLKSRARRTSATAAVAMGLAASTPSLAQDSGVAVPTSPAPAPPAPDSATATTAPPADAAPQASAASPRVFAPDFFASFAPRNALDMLRQVPGFTIREPVQERGLGQATANVLLNGRRIAAKSEDIQTQLSRIPAANV